MISIKFILLIPLVALIFAFLPRLRNRTFYRLALILVAAAGVVFVLFPQVTDRLAHFVGVGRGADLVTYLFIVFFFLACIMLYSKIRKLEAEYTELIRKISLQNAQKPNHPI